MRPWAHLFRVDRDFVNHYSRVMKNDTITLEEEVARWARIRVAEHDTSVSRFVGELLRDRMVEERTYEAAMRDYLAQPPRKLRQTGKKCPRREKLHDRTSLRFPGEMP